MSFSTGSLVGYGLRVAVLRFDLAPKLRGDGYEGSGYAISFALSGTL